MDQCPFSNSLPSWSRADVNSAGGPASSVLPMAWDGIRSHCPCYCWCQWLPCDALWIGQNWLVSEKTAYISHIYWRSKEQKTSRIVLVLHIFEGKHAIYHENETEKLPECLDPDSSKFILFLIHKYSSIHSTRDVEMSGSLGLVSFKRFFLLQPSTWHYSDNMSSYYISQNLDVWWCMKRTAKWHEHNFNIS